MFYRLLSSDPKRFVEFGESALYALIGFALVVVGIAFLIFVVWLVGKLMSKTVDTSKALPKKVKPMETKVEVPKEEAKMMAEDEISEETLAILTAAIMAYYEKNNPKCEFIVKRIKRI